MKMYLKMIPVLVTYKNGSKKVLAGNDDDKMKQSANIVVESGSGSVFVSLAVVMLYTSRTICPNLKNKLHLHCC